MKRFRRARSLTDVPGIWRRDAEKLQSCGVRTVPELIASVRSDGLGGLSERADVPEEQLQEYLLIAEWEEFKQRLKSVVVPISLAGVALLAGGASFWASREAPTDLNREYTLYVEAEGGGDTIELGRITELVDSLLIDSEFACGESGSSGAGLSADVADLALLRAKLYRKDEDLDCAKQLNLFLAGNNSHKGYAFNNLGNIYLKEAERLADSRFDMAKLRVAADSAELAYNEALRSTIDEGASLETLRTTIQHNIYHLQARRRQWLEQEEDRGPEPPDEEDEGLEEVKDSIASLIAKINQIENNLSLHFSESDRRAVQDTIFLLLEQVRTVVRETDTAAVRDTASR